MVRILASIMLGLACLVLLQLSAPAQPLTLEIKSIDMRNYPHLRFETLLSEAGVDLSREENITWTLTENGVSVPFTMNCPKEYNSVALIYDNTQIIVPPQIEYEKTTFIDIVDTLKPNDEYTLISTRPTRAPFGQPQFRIVDSLGFTTDKTKLRNYMDLLFRDIYSLSASFYLWETVMYTFDRLSERTGDRICILHIHKGDPTWVSPYKAQLVEHAMHNNIMFNVIAYYSVYVGEREDEEAKRNAKEYIEWKTIAELTGGGLYYYRYDSLKNLQETFASVLAAIDSQYCNIRYTTSNCTDTLAALRLSATVGNRSVFADTLLRLPNRPDTLILTVESEQEEIVPPKWFKVYFRLDPGANKDLPLSFTLRLLYDDEALEYVGPPIDESTMSANSTISVRKSSGALNISGSHIYPAQEHGYLFGCGFRAKTTAGSRPVALIIDTLTMESGCPNTVIAYPDTIYICRCSHALPFEAQATTLVTGDYVTVSVMLPDTLIYGNNPFARDMLFSMNIAFDSSSLEPISVDGIGTVSENALLKWRVKHGGTLEVYTSESFPTMPGTVLYNVRFRVKQQKAPVYASIGVPSLRLFTGCCYVQSDSLPNAILIDGLCDKVVRRRADFTLEPNSPNPAQGETSFRFTVHEQERFSEAQAILTLYRSDGTVVGELYNNSVRPGEYAVPYNLASLPAGTYYYTLSISGRVQTRSMVVVR